MKADTAKGLAREMKPPSKDRIIVIGAGVGGLTAALELAVAGFDVTVLEAHGGPGGKMRTLPSPAGPVDAGPTVFTMKPVFDALFALAGTSVEDELTLYPCETLARHQWQDGSTLDLFADQAASIEAVRAFAGGAEATRFDRFTRRANHLYNAFDAPLMRAAKPTPLSVTRAVMADALRLLPAMAPASTLWASLGRQFQDPRLRQLFGRYATYVGGSPLLSPAVLMLIWASEQRGVWRIEGGMHALAQCLERLCRERGVQFAYNAPVARIETSGDRVCAVRLATGERIATQRVLFNGDPSALGAGLLGTDPERAAPQTRREDRSLSAWVWTWAAQASGFALSHHTVFFGASSRAEFTDLFGARRIPRDPTLYICAQDRHGDRPPDGPERFQIIMNAPADGDRHTPSPEEIETCTTTVFERLRSAGLTISPPTAAPRSLTTPDRFARLFPGTGGALYGANPHGPLKTFTRPTAVTTIKGLFLCGGGCHPGPGVPMAALSGRHAAAAIAADRASTSASMRTATHGGISTASPTTGATASP